MARELISVSSISINDLNDAVVSGTAPSNPDEGMLWLNDNVLKQYTNGKWQTVTLDILRMDEVLKTTINSIEETLGNISADGNLSFVDREVVSQNVGEIIGEMPSTSTSSMDVLPDYTVLDSKGVGTFAFLRSTALSVGITEDDPLYKEMEVTYKNLASYLASTNPKMWDVTDDNKDKSVTLSNTDDFNGYFLNYYLAEAAMSAEIDKRANELMLKITEGSKSGVVVSDIEGTELYTTKADLNGGLDIVVEGGTENLVPLGEGRNYAKGTSSDFTNVRVSRWSGSLANKATSQERYTLGELGVRAGDTLTVSMYVGESREGYGGGLRIDDQSGGNKYSSLKVVKNDYVKETFTIQGSSTEIRLYTTGGNESGASMDYDLPVKELKIEKGTKATPWTPAPDEMTRSNLISANNFNLVSQMGKFKNISNREDTKEITDIWTKDSATTEVLNGSYTSEQYPYLNLRKVGFNSISSIFRQGGENFGEGIRGGVYTYVLYLKPLVANFDLSHDGLNNIKGIMYKDGVKSNFTGNQTLMKGSEYLIIASFTHRNNNNFWQLRLNNHKSANTEFVMSNLMLFEGDVASEIDATLPGVGTVINPNNVTGAPEWAKISASYVELPQPLRDAGNGVRDQLRRNEDGSWEIYRRVNELELQDNLSGLSSTASNVVMMPLYDYTGKNALGRDNATGYITGLKSSHFTYSDKTITPNSTDWEIGTDGNAGERAYNLMFKLPPKYGTAQKFKDYITTEANKGNPIKVVYELREPYVEELSDETQITLDRLLTYPHSNTIYTIFPGLDKNYNHPHPYLRANFIGGGEATRKRTQADLDTKANKEDLDSINDAIVTVNANTENLGDRLENTVTELTSIGDTVSGIESKVTQTIDGWDFRFSNFSSTLSNLETETSSGFSRINNYIRFENGNIILGQEGSNTFLEISPDRINFNNGGAIVAYISNQTMEITHGIFVETATIAGMRIQRVPGSNNIGFTII